VVLLALFTAKIGVDASSFERDVVRKSDQAVRRTSKRQELQNAIFGRLRPLEGHPHELEVRASLGKEGFSIPDFRRHLEDADDAYGGYGFDIGSFSLKFARCQTIKTYSDNAAQEEGQSDVLVAKNFVVFRLCPSDYCDDNYKLGCKKYYNQYLMPLPDYLEFMQEFIENQKEAYCGYCEQCFQDDDERRRLRKVVRKLDEDNDDADNEDEEDEDEEDEDEEDDEDEDEEDEDEDGDDAYEDEDDEDEDEDGDDAYADDEDEDDEDEDEDGDDAYGDDAAGDDAAGDDAYYNAACNVCDEDTYNAKCYEADDDYQVDYQDWFECTQVGGDGDDDGNAYYAMAHCSDESDATISVALFSDQYCTILVGGTDVASNTTGIAFNEYGMEDYYPESCVTCNATELNAQYEEGQDNDDDGINDLCANVYQGSAQCNMQGNNDDDYNDDSDVCLFIESVLSGSYDSSGDIYLNSQSSGTSGDDVGQNEKIVLAALVFLTVAMAIWAIKLHMSIMTKIPWKPRYSNKEKLLDDDTYDRDGAKEGTMA